MLGWLVISLRPNTDLLQKNLRKLAGGAGAGVGAVTRAGRRPFVISGTDATEAEKKQE